MVKCSLTLSTCVRFLGFLHESVRQAYILPNDKIEKFAVLRKSILQLVNVKTTQRFTGK